MTASTIAEVRNRRGLAQRVRSWPATDPWAAALVVHGLAEHSGRYERTGGLMASAGLEVRALDLTGFGGSGGRRAFVPELGHWLDDIADRLEELPDGLPRVLLGHSMGGLVCAAYLLSPRVAPDVAVLSAPALGADVPVWKQRAASLLGRLTPKLEVPNQFHGALLSRDPAVGEAYMADPLVYKKTTARLGQILIDAIADVRTRAATIDLPTLVIHGADDKLVPTEVSAVLEASPHVTRRVLTGLRHEAFNEPEGPEVVAEVVDWIKSTITSR